LPRLIALIDPANEASMRTAERAGLGFEREIELEGVRSSLYAVALRPR
jgi:RimJ/RimL family protein N-acetyltransferase